MSRDTLTTLLGSVIGFFQAMNVDYTKLFHGDMHEISRVISAIGVALLGYHTNKQGNVGDTNN